MIKKLLSFLIVIALLGSCKRWTAVPEPSYIQISNYTTKVASDGQQGTANQNYTDMQVIANGTTYGIFPLGAKIPVIGSGSLDFTIKAVVEINGVSALRSTYEVMKGCDTIINVAQGQVTNIVPTFEYFTDATFPYINGFDGYSTGNPLIRDPSTDTTSRLVAPGMSGKSTDFCLKMSPDSASNGGVTMLQTKQTIGLPSGGVGVYMEFNYMGNIPISVAIQGIPPNGATPTAITSCGGVYPTTTWQKAYVQLTEQVSSLQSGSYYIYFTCLYDNLVPGNAAYIDNIKIVTAH